MNIQIKKVHKGLTALLCVVLSLCMGLMVPVNPVAYAVEKQSEAVVQPDTGSRLDDKAEGNDTGAAIIDEPAKEDVVLPDALTDNNKADKNETANNKVDKNETANDEATEGGTEEKAPQNSAVEQRPTVPAEDSIESEISSLAQKDASVSEPLSAVEEDDAVAPQAQSEEKSLSPQSKATVNYKTHVENIGWQTWKTNGVMSGTSGKALRLEGIKINVSGIDGGIEYRTHVQNIGWQAWNADNAMSGTSGQALRLEAIQIRLTGNAAKQYDVYYRVHTQNIGWMDWAKNGEQSGSAGYSYRLEGIQVVLKAKGAAAPQVVGGIASATSSKFINYNATGDLTYNSTLHIQDYGDRTYKSYNGSKIMGTSGEAKRLERFSIALNNNTGLSGNIRYRTHVQNVGWQDWKENGQAAGTSGRALRLEALQIYLDGDLGENYDVYYQVHVQNIGWQDWKTDGAIAGTSGQALRLEAMRIVIVKKGETPPSATTNNNANNNTQAQYYTATFKNYNGKTLATYSVKKGGKATYKGETPTKPATAATAYTFTGWSPALKASTTDVTYTAQFAAHAKKSYTVKFTGYDNPTTYGAESKQNILPEGSRVYAPSWKITDGQRVAMLNKDREFLTDSVTITTPQKTKGCYAFMGWKSSQNGRVYQNNNLPTVSGNVTYTAQWKNLGYESILPTFAQEQATTNKFYPQANLIKNYWEEQKAKHEPAWKFYNVTVIRGIVATAYEREWGIDATFYGLMGESTGLFKYDEKSVDVARVIEYNKGNPIIIYYIKTLG